MKIAYIIRNDCDPKQWGEKLKQKITALVQKQVQGVVLSNQSLMGPLAYLYGEFGEFIEKQEQALNDLQMFLPKDFIVILSIISQYPKGGYQPLFLTKQKRVQSSHYTFEGCKLGAFSTEIFKDFKEKFDIAFLLNEKPFAFEKDTIVSHQNMQVSTQNGAYEFGAPVFHSNLALVKEDHVWDGTIAYYNPHTKESFFKKMHQEQELIFELNEKKVTLKDSQVKDYSPTIPLWQEVREHIVAAIKSYYKEGGFKKIVVGLSGGIDSALVATLAVQSVGANNVLGVLMPGPFSSNHSIDDSLRLCKNLAIEHNIIPINPIYDTFLTQLSLGSLKEAPFGIMHENLQARARGTLLMAYSNHFGALVLNTCNKSEDAVGYSTLYGDAIGGFAPIGDLYKTEIYKLAESINKKEGKEIIPHAIFSKAPSAELKENQKDSDSLPSYNILDAILRAYLDEKKSPKQIAIELSLKQEEVFSVIKKIYSSEYKRKQSPLVLRLTPAHKGLYRNFPFLGNPLQ
jgi:NAD+ synthase (glutamine-hydrolysing)